MDDINWGVTILANGLKFISAVLTVLGDDNVDRYSGFYKTIPLNLAMVAFNTTSTEGLNKLLPLNLVIVSVILPLNLVLGVPQKTTFKHCHGFSNYYL